MKKGKILMWMLLIAVLVFVVLIPLEYKDNVFVKYILPITFGCIWSMAYDEMSHRG